MSWGQDAEALDKAVQELVDKVFVKDPEALLETEDGKTKISGDLEPLYAIQAYLTSGCVYPTTDEDFREDVPESAFDPVKTELPDIYNDTKKCVLAVSKSCHGFKEKTLSDLLSYPDMMIIYVNTALPLLDDPESGLRTQVEILTNRKYDIPKDQDDAFFDAKEIVKDNLQQMKKKAQEKKDQSEALKRKLDDFLIETTANKDLVDTADAEYSKLITVNGSKYDSCIAYLDKDLARLEKAEQDALNQKQIVDTLKERFTKPSHFEYWAIALGTPRFLIDEPLKIFHEAAVNQLNNAKSSKAQIYNSRRYIFAMSVQLKGLLPRMSAAIDALNRLALIFDSQVRNIELLIGDFDRIDRGENSTVGAIRRSNINAGIKYAIENYGKIKTAAEEFEKHARLRTTAT